MAQQTAHDAFAIALGNDEIHVSSNDALNRRLLELRDGIATGSVVVVNAGPSSVDGLAGVIYDLYGSTINHPDVAELIDEVASDLNEVSSRAGEFFSASRRNIEVNGKQLQVRGVDPSTATLNPGSSLSGLKGSTATAYFTNTGAPVPGGVVLWPSSYNPCGPWTAGAPCSNYSLTAGQQASQVLVAQHGYCSCQ